VAEPLPLSKPPLNVLIDPTLARRKSPWEIDISQLLDLFLQAISRADTVDMRAAGTAALSSATIYRLKVETLFLFERLRARGRLVDGSEPPQIIVMPFRYEVYSTNVDELFDELSKILQDIMADESAIGEGSEQSIVSLADLPAPDLEQYVISLQAVLSEYRKILTDRLKETGKAMFSELVKGLNPLAAARVFILILFAASEGQVVIEQEEGDEDALIVSVGQLE